MSDRICRLAAKEETMKFGHITPEKAGVSSRQIKKLLEVYEANHFSTHDLILIRGNEIFFENYWAPFTKDFMHRMYSVSKSFVSIAIGFLEQDGLIGLDDKIVKYFPKETENEHGENLHKQTIRHMLMMSTSVEWKNWFGARCEDRVRFYFEGSGNASSIPGTFFAYDSTGSFVLGALVERLTGKPFMEYLREKLFDKIGVSKDAYCLKCPGGHSWGDSAVICTPEDLALVARFVMNKGKWEGEQILNEEYLTLATTPQIFNNDLEVLQSDVHGYGYQFWMTYRGGFYFNGMGCQFAVCVPDKDMIMIYNADNQGRTNTHRIIDKFFELIVDGAADEALPEDEQAQEELKDYAKDLKLAVAIGEETTPLLPEVNGKTYILDKNPMGIKWFRLEVDGNVGHFVYENDQGEKDLIFGLGYNEFSLFPQEGYSDEVGSVSAPGNYYRCAASAGWVQENMLNIRVQVIDKYFGNLNIYIGYKNGEAAIRMIKIAEDFMNEYSGQANGRVKE